MKKGLLLLILMALMMKSQAQTEKGNFLLGFGTNLGLGENDGLMVLAFSNSKVLDGDVTLSETKQTSIFGTTKIGYFVANNLATGVDLGGSFISRNTVDSGPGFETRRGFLSVGPFVRYYVPSGKIVPFAEVNALFGSRNETISLPGIDFETKSAVANYGGGLGLAFFLGEKSSFDLGLNYNSTRLNHRETEMITIQNSLGLRLAFTVYL